MKVHDDMIGRNVRSNLLIKAWLGEGGMGRVYLAENVEIREKKYAIKVLKREFTYDPSFRQRFYDEARHQAQLDHPNIVQMLDYFHVGNDYFLVLEYVDGQPLSALIESNAGKGLPEKRALSIIAGMLAGLNCAHERAILHRDVKSSNVLLDKTDRARLTDFGIALQADGLSRTPEGHIIGTAAYMSPEQLQNSREIDHRSDVYSAGVVLFEMLTGKLPFEGDSFDAVQAQQASSPVPDPRSVNRKVSKRVADIVRHALQKNPVDRYQGCLQFLKAIERYQRRSAWKYWLVSACVLIAAAVYVGKSMVLDRPLIRDSVRNAARDYNIFCHEQQLLVQNTEGKRIADLAGLSEQSDLFASRIAGHKANLDSSFREYSAAIEHMHTFNHWTLASILSEPAPEPSQGNPQPQVAADYNRFASTRELPGKESMLQQCRQLGWTIE